jgi:hypothetical protein
VLLGAQFLDVRCAYVVKRLQSSSFTKLLSGAKECHRILESASSSKKGARAVPTLEVRRQCVRMPAGWQACHLRCSRDGLRVGWAGCAAVTAPPVLP